MKKKKIEKIKDIILNLPYSETDRSKISKLNKLEIGKIQSIKVSKKLNFPRIRNLQIKLFARMIQVKKILYTLIAEKVI